MNQLNTFQILINDSFNFQYSKDIQNYINHLLL